ncbi:MAG: WD40/YVTN/BNR-like repeat-containing protein [Bacteroidales bacterium]
MMNKALLSLTIILLIFLGSCRDEIDDMPTDFITTKLHLQMDGEIKDMLILNDSSWYICGGDKSDKGFIFLSENQGQSWETVLETRNHSVNALFYSPEAKYLAGGDSIKLWRSEDGRSWRENPRAPCYWSSCRNPYHALHVWKKNLVFAVGGEYFQRGITSRSTTGDSYWVQLYWPNQLNDMIVNHHEVTIAGYAMVLHSDDTAQNFRDMKMYKKNYISLAQTTNGDMLMLAEEGNIYKLTENGWEEKADLQGRFRDLAFSSSSGIAIGDKGIIAIGNAQGENWKIHQFINDKHLSCVTAIAQGFLLGCRDGSLYLLENQLSDVYR